MNLLVPPMPHPTSSTVAGLGLLPSRRAKAIILSMKSYLAPMKFFFR
jgi:hypothetical protein